MTPMPEHNWVFLAQLTRVVDGDTVDMVIDHGMHARRVERLRLLRVNAPEMRTPTYEAGHVAKAYVEAWLAEGVTNVWPFIVQTYKSDSFGRYLAEVWRISDGANLSDALLESGNAVVYQ